MTCAVLCLVCEYLLLYWNSSIVLYYSSTCTAMYVRPTRIRMYAYLWIIVFNLEHLPLPPPAATMQSCQVDFEWKARTNPSCS